MFVLKSCLSTDDINLLWGARYINSFLWRWCLCYWHIYDIPWHDICYLSSAVCETDRNTSALLTPKMAGKRILLLVEEIMFNPVTYCFYWKIPQLPIILCLLSLKFLITYTVVTIHNVSWHRSEHNFSLHQWYSFYGLHKRIIKWWKHSLSYYTFSYFLNSQFNYTVHNSEIIER